MSVVRAVATLTEFGPETYDTNVERSSESQEA